MNNQNAIEILGGFNNARKRYASGKQIDRDRFDTFSKAIEMAIESLEITNRYRWIPVEERLPEREEWIGIKGKEHYLRRMEIAVDSDTIEYFLVFYDGYKWFDKFGRTYAGIKAWKIHEPFIPPKC